MIVYDVILYYTLLYLSRSSGDEDPNAGAGRRQAETVGTGTKGELYFKLIIQNINHIQKSKNRKSKKQLIQQKAL